jgi:hypothetical protein
MNQDRGIIRRLHSKLTDTVQISFLELQNILREMAASIDTSHGEEKKATSVEEELGNQGNNSLDRNEFERRRVQRQLMIEWSACLAAIEAEHVE